MPFNNPALYNSAFAGVSGGGQQRWITDPVAANYLPFRQACVAFATAVDTAIPTIVGGASASDAQLLQSICQGVMANRFVESATTGDYTDLAAAVAALFVEQQGGETPAPSPGADPLSGAWWVDIAATGAALQDGSAGNPYAEINAAVAAALAAGLQAITLLVVSCQAGQSYAAVSVDTSSTLLYVTILGQGIVEQVQVDSITWTTGLGGIDRLTLSNINVSGDVTCVDPTGAQLQLNDFSLLGNLVNTDQETNVVIWGRSLLFGSIQCGTLNARDAIILGSSGINCEGTAQLYNCGNCGNISGASSLLAYNCVIGVSGTYTSVGARTIALFDCTTFLDAVSLEGADSAIYMRDCLIVGGPNAVTFTVTPGTVNMDSTTRQSFEDQGGPLGVTNGTIACPALPQFADIVVAVPATAAGVLAYLDVSMVGTAMEGIAQYAPVTVNPQTDIEAAGANNGGLLQVSVPAANTVRLAFKGALTGGNVTMRFARVG